MLARETHKRLYFPTPWLVSYFKKGTAVWLGSGLPFRDCQIWGPRSVERNTRCYGGFSFTSARRKEQIGVWIAVDTSKRIFSLIWNPAMHESRSLKWFLSYFTWQNMCHIIHHFKAQNLKNLKLWLTQKSKFPTSDSNRQSGSHICTAGCL